MSPTRPAAPFPDLVEESLEEATFLWGRWEHELASLTRTLDDVVSWTEDRLHGAIAGVRVGGGVSDVVMNGLLSAEPARVAVCTAVLSTSSEPVAIDTLVDALRTADGERLHAMIRGLELQGSDQALRTAASTLAKGGPAHAGALCRLKAFRRVAPGAELVAAVKSDSTEAQIEAIRAAVYAPSRHAEQLTTAALRSGNPQVRLAAVESGLAGGVAQAWDVAKRMAGRRGPDTGAYLRLVALLGTASDHEIVYQALRVESLRAPAIWALGHVGTVRAVETCLAGMKHEDLARACGEAYCWITGTDLARDRLAADETPVDAPPFEEDDLEADLVPAPEALWPLPDPQAIARDWQARAAAFSPDVRYAHGQPAGRETLVGLVERAPMLRRPDIVLELRARTHGQYDVETRAFAARQREMMAAARATLTTHDGH
jgi:uncharacterized protein (TIGR02270 family)